MRSWTAAWLVSFALPLPLAAVQRPMSQDTVVSLDALVITADRTASPLATSIAAVSVLTRTQLRTLPQVTLADALRRVPGFAAVDFDGLGYDPQLMVRGFYGGGEAEYVVVLLDGRPLNDVTAGLVAWDAIPLAAAERIEIVRGGASSLWGDAAVGGVINVVTRASADASAQGQVTGGSHGSWHADARVHGALVDRAASIFGGVDRTAGFRDHAARTSGRAGGVLELASGSAAAARISALAHWRTFDEPGPLLEDDLATNRAASDVFHRFDQISERTYRLGLDADRRIGGRAHLSGAITADARDVGAVRTIALSPDFADTKERVLDTARAVASAQLDMEAAGLPFPDRLVLGADASYATLDSRYYSILTGDRDAYRSGTGERDSLDASGSGRRSAAALFAQYTVFPVGALRISAGARVDWLRDTFTAREPEDAGRLEAAHTAFSPRLGLNVQYARGAAHAGNVYVTAGRSFKAPTLDQLFDQRRLPVPFPPFSITTANALLEPQHGVSLEGGIFHTAALLPRTLTADITVSLYQMDMENEIDFDLQTLRYINIGRSRHRGIEAGITIHGPRASSAFANYTLQHVTARSGEHTGRQLKAVPRHYLSGGLNATAVGRLDVGIVVSHARNIFLDDANTLTLPAWTRVDARVSHPVAGLRLFLDVRNLFDAHYSTTGFPDPGGSGAVYHHPAAGRTFDLGVRGSIE